MKCNILQATTSTGEVAYLLPHTIDFITKDVDVDKMMIHTIGGETLIYNGTEEALLQWLKQTYRSE